MMCNNPFVRLPTGIGKLHSLYTEESRLAATPFACGQCFPCRVNQCRIWTHRLLLEQTQHGDSSFITLTYNDDNIPEGGNLVKTDLQNFLKRLRKRLNPLKIRYYAVGEYGDERYRPHFHLAMFGIGNVHTSAINTAWNSGDYNGDERGYTYYGDLNKDTARYITGYITKKLTARDDPHLKTLNKEFMTCSKVNGGIGYGAIKKIAQELLKNPYFEPRILRELNYGKKRLPLGRYLTNKLSDDLGVSDSDIEKAFKDYQDNIFDMHAGKPDYLDSIIDEESAKRYQQRKRYQIYKQKRRI